MKNLKTFENFASKQAVKFVKKGGKNKEHYDRAVEFVVNAIENGEIDGTLMKLKIY